MAVSVRAETGDASPSALSASRSSFGSRARGCRSRPSCGAKSPSAHRANPDGRGAPWRTIKPSIVGYPRPWMKVPKAHELFRRMSSAEVASCVAAACEDDCLLYTSDAADDLLCVDLGGRRII